MRASNILNTCPKNLKLNRGYKTNKYTAGGRI